MTTKTRATSRPVPSLFHLAAVVGFTCFGPTLTGCGKQTAPRVATVSQGPPPTVTQPTVPSEPEPTVVSIDGAGYCASGPSSGGAWLVEGTWEPEHWSCLRERPLTGEVSIGQVDAQTMNAVLDHGAGITDLHVQLHTRDQLERVVRLSQLKTLAIDIDRGPSVAPDWMGQREAVLTVEDFARIAQLTGLQELHLGYIPVDERKLAQLGSLHELEALSLSGAGLTASSLKLLRPFQKLRRLMLGRLTLIESLEDFDDEALSHLAALPHLRLGQVSIDPSLTDRGLKLLGRYWGWKELNLSSTQVTDGGLAHVSHWKQLEKLDLSSTQLSSAALDHIGGFASLSSLNLSRTTVDDAGLAKLAGLDALEHLDLSGTTIDDDAATHLSRLTSLKILDLAGTKISDAGVERLATLPQLKRIDLSYTLVGDDGLAALANRGQLVALSLRATRVTDDGLTALTPLDGLRSLNLIGLGIGPGIEHIPGGVTFLNLRRNPRVTAALLERLALGRDPQAKTVVLIDDRPDLRMAAEQLHEERPVLELYP